MGDREHLHDLANSPEDDAERKAGKADAPNLRLAYDLESQRRGTCPCDRRPECEVIALTEPGLAFLVVGDLPLMLQSRLWMQRVDHFSSAATRASSSCADTSLTAP